LAEAGSRAPALTAAQATAFAADASGAMAGFSKVGADGVPMPSIPEMGQVWQFWGVTQANILEGNPTPTGAWAQMVRDIQRAIG
jgi:arabinogalactan oligomer/maltooligosaccharide transport system substrate-binding protein